MIDRIDLNSDLGEAYGPCAMGNDDAILQVVTSANVACGGHAGDAETMFKTLRLAAQNRVTVGAHPGYVDLPGFGRRIIPMSAEEIGRMVAAQIGALMGIARLAGTSVKYVKPHGALANLAADDEVVARAVANTIKSLSDELAILAISGTTLELVAKDMGLNVFSEIFADRAYLSSGRLVPRSHPEAMIEEPAHAVERMLAFLRSGEMPVIDGNPIRLAAQSICVHGDGHQALELAASLRTALLAEGISLAPFCPA